MLNMMLAAGLVATSPLQAGFEWLAGAWCTEPKAATGVRTCERWEAAAGGGMRGITEKRREQMVRVEEQMEIRREGERFVFHAEPKGQAPTDFPAATIAGQSATFENRAHDYPQRIRYWREGETLFAEISLADGSKPMRWEYRRIK